MRDALLAAGLVSASLGLGALSPAAAQVRAPSQALHAGTVEVPLNKSQVVSTDRAIAKAMIGNDEIADVVPITDRSIYVLGKAMGTTSLTLYDSAGRVLSIMDIAVGPDVQALREQLTALVPGQEIEARISNASIVLSGTVSDPGAVDRAVQIAKSYAGDKVVNLVSMGSSQQVMLEVRFAEVNRTNGMDVGMSAFLNSGTFSSAIGKGAQLVPGGDVTTTIPLPGGGTATTTQPGGGILKLLSITDTFGIFRKQFSLGSLGIDAVLNAMETKGIAKTLAQPTLIALSGQRASFLAGGEFPVPVAQSGGAGSNNGTAITVEFKPFGVSLGFTPTVLGDKTINLIVEPEVSAIDPTASLTLGGITIPGLRTRRASTTLELRDGESFAIAGLLQRDFKTTVSQLPILGSLPIIGSLFRSSNFQKGETELLIVVTPRLVAPIRPGQVRLPTDAMTDPTAAEAVLFGTGGRRKALPSPDPVGPAATFPNGQAPALSPQGANGTATAPKAKEGSGYEY